jgi:amino acid adenylation domain-containing protein
MIEDIRDLTPLQAGILYHGFDDAGTGQYFLQQTIHLTDALDDAAFDAALAALATRHEALRSSFVIPSSSGRPRQVLLSERAIETASLNHSALTSEEHERALEEFCVQDRARGFNVEKDSLLRVTRVAAPGGGAAVVFSMHHIIVDGWSLQLLLADFARYYAALCAGTSSAELLTAVQGEKDAALSYGDYLGWLKKRDVADALHWWKDLLEGYEGLADIAPLEDFDAEGADEQKRARALSTGDSTGGEVLLALDENQHAALEEVGRTLGVTLSVMVEVAWGIVLQRYNRSEDVVFGKVVSGRGADLPGIERTVGLFINTIPVRVQVRHNAQTTLRDLLRATQQQSLDSGEYDFVPLIEIQREERRGEELFRTILAFENFPTLPRGDEQAGSEALGSAGPVREQTNYPLSLKAYVNNTLCLELLYDSRRYSAREVEAILARVRRVLIHMAHDSTQAVEELDLTSDEERRLICEVFNDTAQPIEGPLSLVAAFEREAERYPQRVVVEDAEQNLTYAKLNARANRLARGLLAHGVTPGSMVALLSRRTVELPVAIMGTLKAGAAFIPLDRGLPVERLAFMLEDSAPTALLTVGVSYDGQLPEGCTVLDLSNEQVWDADDSNLPAATTGDSLAYCIYTSGSTGTPKGVLVEHHGAVNVARNKENLLLYGAPAAPRMLSLSNQCFDAFILELFLPLLNGGYMYLDDHNRDSRAVIDALRAHDIECIVITPTQLRMLLAESPNRDWLATLQVLAGGAEVFDDELYRELRPLTAAQIHNLYGPTETTVYATDRRIEALPVDIGFAQPNVQLYVMNGEQLSGIGVPGELCIAGIGVTRGYLNRPELTAERFAPNPFGEGRLYRTGDVVRVKFDGSIDYLGRADDQVKLHGLRLELGEIESLLAAQPGVVAAAAAVRPNAAGAPALCAWYVVQRNAKGIETPQPETLRTALARRLPYYMVPTALMEVPAIPLNSSGKADRKQLPDIEYADTGGPVAPRTPLEEQILAVVSEVLGVASLGVEDDFFAVGGDSIKAIGIVSRLAARGVELSVQDVFQHRTVAAMAAEVAKEDGSLKAQRAAQRDGMTQRDEAAQRDGMTQRDGSFVSFATQKNRPSVSFRPSVSSPASRSVPLAEVPLAPPQRLSWYLGVRSSFARVRIDAEWDEARFLAAWKQLLEEFDVLRSSICVADDATGTMQVWETEELSAVSFVDLSDCDDREEQLERISAELLARGDENRYDGTQPVCIPVCVKMTEKLFFLLAAVSHLVFDAFSNEVMAQRLRALYAGGSPGPQRSYYAYAATLSQGPARLEDAALVEGLALNEFAAAAQRQREACAAGGFELIDYRRAFAGTREEATTLCDRLICEVLRFTWGEGAVPLFFVQSNRNMQGHNFSGFIGEFIDLCPALVAPQTGGLLAELGARAAFAREHAISVASLLFDEELAARYPRSSRLLREALLSEGRPQILNLLLMQGEQLPQPMNVYEAEGEAREEESPLLSANILNVTWGNREVVLKNLVCPVERKDELCALLDHL